MWRHTGGSIPNADGDAYKMFEKSILIVAWPGESVEEVQRGLLWNGATRSSSTGDFGCSL